MAEAMKSFRLHRHKLMPITEFILHFPHDEQMRFREAFRPALERYRRQLRFAYWPGAVFVISGILATADWNMYPKSWRYWFLGVSICAFAVVGTLGPRLPKCPACGNRLGYKGRYCPECGGELETVGWFSVPRCRSCHKILHSARTRNFKIRGCTHCGVFLDEKGL